MIVVWFFLWFNIFYSIKYYKFLKYLCLYIKKISNLSIFLLPNFFWFQLFWLQFYYFLLIIFFFKYSYTKIHSCHYFSKIVVLLKHINRYIHYLYIIFTFYLNNFCCNSIYQFVSLFTVNISLTTKIHVVGYFLNIYIYKIHDIIYFRVFI